MNHCATLITQTDGVGVAQHCNHRVPFPQAHGNTALHMAAGLHGHPFQEQIVHLLLQHWADPSARNLENEQPVHLLAPGPASEHVS